ncbi:glycoside hydrolase [Chitinophaga sedimenti]|uniref:WD40/YVTN/BNR-like repeat-containing protein n=1 Tax=Chitinophaga sedimenti TaxID=2033606 RepID=UPI002004EF16|nr:sialidase family protein [Chitinophaga sedimenti]MCK7554873.1 glycoside hydrolase [Chitinophaga sedimenti]
MLGAKIPATYWNWANGAVTGDLAFDPNDVTGNTLYVTLANGKGAAPGQGLDTKGTVMKSTDRGDSWTDCGLAVDIKPNSDQTFTDRLVVDPNNSNVIWLATRSNGVWRSTSAGVTGSWVKQTSISDTLFGRFIKFDVSGGTQGGVTKNMFIGTNYGIYRSTDGGATFAAMIGGPSGVRRASIAKNGVMFVTATPSSTNNGVWKWNGSGWSGVSPDNAREFKHVSVNPDNSNEVIAASTSSWASEKMWRSTSGGNLGTWTEMSHTRDKTEAPHSEMSTAAGNIGFSIDMVTFDPFNPGMFGFPI